MNREIDHQPLGDTMVLATIQITEPGVGVSYRYDTTCLICDHTDQHEQRSAAVAYGPQHRCQPADVSHRISTGAARILEQLADARITTRRAAEALSVDDRDRILGHLDVVDFCPAAVAVWGAPRTCNGSTPSAKLEQAEA
jgi:hypothetical protein